MKSALFCNTNEPVCGVQQMGMTVFSILKPSARVHWDYYDGPTMPFMHLLRRYDAILYNYQGLIGGWMNYAPFRDMKNQWLIYHDLDIHEEKWTGILFADETMAPRPAWHKIGRPLPEFRTITPKLNLPQPIVGVHGFLGAWANRVVSRVMEEFEVATIRLHLPFSKFCDPDGNQARAMAAQCRALVATRFSVKLEVTHEFLPQQQLLEWLSQNDINCYFRDPAMHWRGVSSAPDCALAVRKPLAVNNCQAFRHLHGVTPSICVEESSLTEIIQNGLSPLIPMYHKWAPEIVRNQIENYMFGL